MRNKYMSLALISSFVLYNNICSMERSMEEYMQESVEENKFDILSNLNPELLAMIVINWIVEPHIRRWDGISDLESVKKEIKKDLCGPILSSKDFLKFDYERQVNFKEPNYNIDVEYLLTKISLELQNKINTAPQNRQLIGMLNIINIYTFKRVISSVMGLIYEGANVNMQGENGNTVLIEAAEYGDIDVVSLLIEKGAKVNIQDKHSDTALMKAVKSGHKDIIKLLISYGADVNIPYLFNGTVLIEAVKRGYADIVKLFIDQGANINCAEYQGNTALINAVKNDYEYIVELLLKAGANSEIRNDNSDSALSFAIVGSRIAKLLLKFRLDRYNNYRKNISVKRALK